MIGYKFTMAQFSQGGMKNQFSVSGLIERGCIFLSQEVFDKGSDVPFPLAKRRDEYSYHVQAIIQILTEFFVPDQPGNRAIGIRKYPDVDLQCVGPANSVEFPGLKNAKQLRLKELAYFRDLFQEDRPVVRCFEQSLLRLVRACVGAFLMTEKFAFKKRLRNCSAVNCNEWFPASAAKLVYCLRDQLLACATLLKYQNRRVARCDFQGQFNHPLHRFEEGVPYCKHDY